MVTAVVRREYVQQKFAMHVGVGQVGHRPFQIGGVLDVQNVFVAGDFHGGRLYGVALAGLLRGAWEGKFRARS